MTDDAKSPKDPAPDPDVSAPEVDGEFALTPGDPGRRRFMAIGAAGLGVGLAGTVVVPGARMLLYPLSHKTTSGSDEPIPAGEPTEFGDEPVKVDLHADKIDAWNRFEDVKIGSAWVVRLGGELVAFSTVCPHLGCAIDYDPEARKFKCPCHDSVFEMDGTVEEGPAPRPLDRLEVQADEKLVAIRYRRFKQGVPDQEPV